VNAAGIVFVDGGGARNGLGIGHGRSGKNRPESAAGSN
jgi:hypothetical protein